jgi:hypothetical protein
VGLPGVADLFGEHRRLIPAAAPQPPGGEHQAVEGGDVGRVDGPVVGEPGVAQGLEFGGIFIGQDDLRRAEAVPDRVT